MALSGEIVLFTLVRSDERDENFKCGKNGLKLR
jgi:hypothetical protein